ncbi:MAG: MotA/TolQ/ExbB proton channel family protein [Candidatus Competibacteraceae bacterium]|nr:MotA/TolQ/ExbB proton channel family protein [Candidatus Competibacteraceae bacterium]MBK7982878.1 MotA/TolQ/ExbB proton channel family protein [Candidatus Competibacteraceae bacterium]MBK8898575.1 MotA/TolQ/ExbB proton channel family protein [Candidatus Competibacteraceae bacterium]MBK8962379.1 MotA/TolQ/ExbB proton channel family protein [Candidatus Competibacteraceae bacterium]MBK9951594.1 MotA/TolQ/ExbB proton channel family protein [Candidatus Competibacteraceae bacterium]
MLDLIKAGGWLMAPLLACSLAATIIIFERLLALRRARVLPEQLVAILRRWSERRAVDREDLDALALDSPLGRIVAAGLDYRGHGREILRERVEDTGRHVVHELERFLNALGTIASISPLLGLLGTVAGMIKIFQIVSVQGNSNFSLLSVGIAEALVTTAAGLTVAIPSVLFYRYFHARVDELVVDMEQETLQLIEVLDGESQHGQQP